MLETNALFRKIAIGNDKLHPLTDENIRDIQAILLEMMKDIDALCRRHGLRYCICGGTALGAVRHRGFIPWDDDADLAMPREDYDRLTALLLAEYGDAYWIQSIETSDKYDLTFMKVRKKGTQCIELFDPEPERSGLFVDIYPMENTPDSALCRRLHGTVCDLLYLCCSCVRLYSKKERILDYLEDKQAIRAVKLKAFLGQCLSFFSLHRWCHIADRWSRRCKNTQSTFVTFPSGSKHYFGELCHRANVLPTQEVAFEDTTLCAMADPTEYLTHLYGDYHLIPPPEKRERHTVLTLNLGDSHE